MRPPPRLTKRPLPRAKDAWEREIAGIRRFLRGMSTYRADHGEGWVGKQTRYYSLRLRDLLTHPPRGVRTEGK